MRNAESPHLRQPKKKKFGSPSFLSLSPFAAAAGKSFLPPPPPPPPHKRANQINISLVGKAEAAEIFLFSSIAAAVFVGNHLKRKKEKKSQIRGEVLF